jgi:hypothetical protein
MRPTAQNTLRLPSWLALLATLSACAAVQPVPDPRDLEVQRIKTELAEVKAAQTEDRAVLYETLAETLCPNPRVRAFFQSCPMLRDDECPLQDLTGILAEMSTLDHTMIYLHLGQNPYNLADERKALIKALVRRHVRRPMTRLFVVALPANLPARLAGKGRQSVAEIARQIRNIVAEYYVAERRETHPKEPPLPTLPPTAITCSQPDQVLRPFLRTPDNRALPTEPSRGQPQFITWAFLVDC